MTRATTTLLALAATLAAMTSPAQAQGRNQLSLSGGPAPYDLSGTGTAHGAMAGFSWRPLSRILVVEPGVSLLTEGIEGEPRSWWAFPEVSVQAEASLGRARPYLGAGTGAAYETRAGLSWWEWTLHGAAGLRLDLNDRWGMRGELRLRGVDPWGGSVAAFGLGVTRRLGA